MNQLPSNRFPHQPHRRSATATAVVVMLAMLDALAWAQSLPHGSQVVEGSGNIQRVGTNLIITQHTDKLATDWQQFSIGAGHTVQFIQPSATSVALNRVIGADASLIQGSLRANGQVFLLNPNGVLFSPTAQVEVGGLLASTLSMSQDDFLQGRYRLSGHSTASVVNQGRMTAAAGGALALVAARVVNEGQMSAPQGVVALGAGRRVTLDLGGPVKLAVDEGALNALITQGGAIRTPGGAVWLTAKAAGDLSSTVIRHTGTSEARSLATGQTGQIMLLGDMVNDRIEVAGVLDASAPDGGHGGFIDTSAARVRLFPDLSVNTLAQGGITGTWLIDPQDYLIAASGGDITGAQLTAALQNTNVIIESSAGETPGAGDVIVRDNVSWSAHNLTLTAARDVRIEALMQASGSSSLTLNVGMANGDDTAVANASVRVGSSPDGTFSGRVDFGGRSGTGLLEINGEAYTVISALGAEGSNTGLDLQGMAGNLAGRYALGSHINASATSTWINGFNPVGSSGQAFTGTLDGLGNVISNLNIDRPNRYGTGLVGVAEWATLRNVGLSSVQILGGERTGALVGAAVHGSIQNVYSSGVVSGAYYVGGLIGTQHELNTRYARSWAAVSGDRSVGGLAGFNGSWIEYSYARGNVTATGALSGEGNNAGGLTGDNTGVLSHSYASGHVTGHSFVGGLTGYSNSWIENTYATGAVTATGDRVGGLVGHHGGSIHHSYATGAVSSPGELVGGLTGHSDYAWGADTGFWDVQRTGQSSSGAGRPMNTADFKARSNFTSATDANGSQNPGWNFNQVWTLYDGQTDPLLRVFMMPLRVTASSDSKTYDGQAYSASPSATFSITPNMGLLAGSLSIGGSAEGATDAGVYSITPQGLYSVQHGYDIAYVSGELTIAPRDITITVDSQQKTFNAPDPLPSYRITSGTLVGDDALTVSLERDPGESLGRYTIHANVIYDGNYNVSVISGELSIQRPIIPEPQRVALFQTQEPSVAMATPGQGMPSPSMAPGGASGLEFVAASDASSAVPSGAAGVMRVLVVSGGIRMPVLQEGQ